MRVLWLPCPVFFSCGARYTSSSVLGVDDGAVFSARWDPCFVSLGSECVLLPSHKESACISLASSSVCM